MLVIYKVKCYLLYYYMIKFKKSHLLVKINLKTLTSCILKINKILYLTCNENTRSAGMGMSAAAKKAQTLLKDACNTLRPVVLKTA